MCHITVAERPPRLTTVSLLRKDTVEPASQGASIQRARLPRDLMPVAKQDECRNTADTEASRQLLLLVGVDFRHLQRRGTLVCHAVEYRGHHPAWAAPRCPEVHQYWEIRALDVGREARLVQCDRLTLQQLRLTAWAFRMLVGTIGRHSNHGVTLRARGQNGAGDRCGTHMGLDLWPKARLSTLDAPPRRRGCLCVPKSPSCTSIVCARTVRYSQRAPGSGR